MGYVLPPTKFDYAALEPFIDEQTVRIHHGRYHQAYVDRLNLALEGTEWADKPIQEVLRNLTAIPAEKRVMVRNMGGGHYNHSLYFEGLSPRGGGAPAGELASAITATFGSLGNFKEAFFDAGCKSLFGSGWAWLFHDGRSLGVMHTANQDNPVSEGKTPLLGIDVWEHAYYPKYLSRRDYFDACWNILHWPTIADRFAALNREP